MKVNDLRDIIMYIVRVNQDKEVNMKNASKVRGFLKEIPQRSKQSSSSIYRDGIAERLTNIEASIKYMHEAIEDLDNSYHDIETRITRLEESIYGID